ncbi:MAG: amino acid adenylation domain-containing protein, partial [Pseudomonadales bacterium]|nr:amino acid adenylation domain-containing protein [Pseudomonadales bacterium]
MSVIELLAQLQAHDIQLYLDNEKLKVNAPKGVVMQDWIETIKAHKPEIISFLKQANASTDGADNILPIDRQSALPLSFSQQRLWFIDQLQNDASYNMTGAFDIQGVLNIQALEKAFTLTIERQEQLRINVISDAGQSEITLRNNTPWKLEAHKVCAEGLQKKLDAFKKQCFDLENDSLIRTQLYQLGDSHWVLAIAMHHIISDAWSLGIFTRELAYFYHASLSEQDSPERLFPLGVQYIDYAAWQREKLQGRYLQDQLDYWQKRLAHCPVLELPVDYPRKAQQTSRAERVEFQLGSDLTEKIKRFSIKNGVTMFTSLLAAYKVLLYRSTGIDDFCVGVPSSFRQTTELEHLIGFFINSLPIRSDLSGSPSFIQLLQKINATRLEAEQYQELPFEQLLEHLGLGRDLNHSPIFQTMFSLEHRSKQLSLPLDGTKTTFSALENEQTKFDLTLTFFEYESKLSGEFEFDSVLFNRRTIEDFSKHLTHILEEIIENPEKPIDEISLLTEQEKNLLIEKWSGQQTPLSRIGLLDLFEQQVALNASALAVDEEGECFSYGDLQQRANKLANYLLANDLKESDVVAVFCTRGYELVVAMLAVIKAGGTYLPIDVTTPDARLKYIVEDAQPRFILSQQKIVSAHKNLNAILPNIICLDSDWRRMVSYSAELKVRTYRPQAPVYIIYTSGSTGLPKGVVVPEQGICNLVAWHRSTFFKQSTAIRMGQVAGAAFDAAAWEIWACLCSGASLIIAPEDIRISAKEMVSWIAKTNLTHLFLPTPLAEAVFAEPLPRNWSLAYLFTGGDKLNQFPPKNRSFKLINAYGPTECSVVATAGEIKSADDHGGLPSIGRPIDNARIYILDKTQQVVPVGVMGELYIGGSGLANEYLNNPELSAEKFLENPYAEGRLYRSGDLAKWLPTGDILYCGRVDQQVQIRGFRVELGEIENVLNRWPEIKESVVRVLESTSGVKNLFAYLVVNTGLSSSFDKTALVRSIKTTLPDYMIPLDYCLVDAIPLTANGKIDYRQLPPFDLDSEQSDHTVPPSSDTEKRIFEIWKAVLENKAFGIKDNFFQIGGHSLLATKVMARLREEFNKNLPLRLIFDNPSISELAESIDVETSLGSSELPKLLPVSRSQFLPLTFAQERLWVLDRLETGASKYNNASAYNISSAFNVRGPLDIDALGFAFSQLVKRHEILRTTFSSAGEKIAQHIKPAYPWFFTIEDVSLEPEQAQLQAIALLQQQEASRAFDLEEGKDARRTRLIRTRLLKRGDEHFVLFITLHHIIADGWSVEIIGQELSHFYLQYLSQGDEQTQSNSFTLPELPVQYADYAVWQKQCLQPERIEKPLAYWQQQLAGLEALELITDYPRPPRQTYSGEAFNTQIPEALTKKIQQFSKQEGVTPFVVLLSAYKILLGRYSGQADICVGTPISQRPVQETEALIGFFINTLPLRSTIGEKQGYREFVHAEYRTTLDAFEFQDIPFEKIVDALDLPRDLSRSPVFQTMFSFQKSDLENSLHLQGLEVDQLPQKNTTSQFELSLALTETREGLLARYDYNTGLFSEESIQHFSQHFENLLDKLLDKPDCALSEISFLSPQETQQQIVAWNDTQKEYPKTEALHCLFEQQVEKTPKDIALVFEQQTLRYDALNRQANQLAHMLIAQGAGKNKVIGLCMQRSLDMVISLYAILKSGAAYLPLDVSSPPDRLQGMLDDANAVILITDIDHGIPELNAAHKIIYSDIQIKLKNQPEDNPQNITTPDDLAYVIYTSGST